MRKLLATHPTLEFKFIPYLILHGFQDEIESKLA
jgi:hypothetical protein